MIGTGSVYSAHLRVRFIVGSIAAHVGLLCALSSLRGRPQIATPDLMVVDLATSPASPSPAPPSAAPAPPAALAPAPPIVRRRARSVPAAMAPVPPSVAPVPSPAPIEPPAAAQAPIDPVPSPVTVPVQRAGFWQAGALFGEGRGTGPAVRPAGLGRGPSGLLERVDADVRRMQGSNDRLSYLLKTWQHNDYVSSCLREKIARTTGAVNAGAAARGRIYAALAKSDRHAVELELARLRRTTVDVQAIYQASRTCVEQID